MVGGGGVKIVRKYRVAIHLKSGATLRFTCRGLAKLEDGDDITRLSAVAADNFPFYIRLGDISAVEAKRAGWALSWERAA